MNGPIVCYVLVYALWLQQGYQEFTRVESSVTVKIKGVTKSELGGGTDLDPCKYSENKFSPLCSLLFAYMYLFFSFSNNIYYQIIESFAHLDGI